MNLKLLGDQLLDYKFKFTDYLTVSMFCTVTVCLLSSTSTCLNCGSLLSSLLSHLHCLPSSAMYATLLSPALPKTFLLKFGPVSE